MTHYVCDECKSESKNPGTCQNDTCIKQGVDLKECNCEDGKHDAILSKARGDDNAEDEEPNRKSQTTTIDLDNPI